MGFELLRFEFDRIRVSTFEFELNQTFNFELNFESTPILSSSNSLGLVHMSNGVEEAKKFYDYVQSIKF